LQERLWSSEFVIELEALGYMLIVTVCR